MDMLQEVSPIDDATSSALADVDQTNDNAMLPIELTNATGTSIEHLNEDCLRAIFSRRELTSMDLCSLAETCTRFKQISGLVFQQKFGDVGNSGYMSNYKFNRILKNFGPYLSALLVRYDGSLVKALAKYCGNATAKRLKIQYLRGCKGLTLKLKTIFQRILALCILQCDLMNVVTCTYINCDSLIELEIIRSTGCVAILRNTFPNLEQFTFHDSYIFSRRNDNCSDVLLNFIARHERLRILDLSAKTVYCSSELIHTIGKNCKKLSKLALREWNSTETSFDFSNLKSLTKLSVLDIDLVDINYRQLSALLVSLKSLRALKLFNFEDVLPVSVLNALSQLQNLRQLHLAVGFFDLIPWTMLTQLKSLYLHESMNEFSATHLLNTITQLTNLEEIEIWDDDEGFELTNKCFTEIVKIVRRRPHILTIRCTLSENFWKNYDKNMNVDVIEYTGY